jgi:hypothetical protein
VVIGTDCIGSCKSNYHMTMATTAPMNFKYDVQHISPNIKYSFLYMYFFHLVIGSDCIGSYKSDYHAFTTAHYWIEICKTNFIFLKYMSCWTHWRAYISRWPLKRGSIHMKPECPKKNHRSVAIHWHTWSKYKTGGNIPKQKAEHDPAIYQTCKKDNHAILNAT